MIGNMKLLEMMDMLLILRSLLKNFFIRLILPSRDEKFNDIHTKAGR